MEKLQALVAEVEAEVVAIKEELAAAEAKGAFSYGRSKEIRKSAMEIIKSCRNMRVGALATFKAGQK